MAKNAKPHIDEERRLRNISDYIFDCTSRLLGHAELLAYLAKHKERFARGEPKQTVPFIVSIFDVYSKDAIIILGNILDEDRKTSSLFTLVDHIKDEKIKKRYSTRLKKLKKDLNQVIRARSNHVAHFNTKLNIHENGYIQINTPAQFDPRYLKKIANRITRFWGDIKEELGIEGLFMRYAGSVVDSFVELLGAKK